MDEMLRALMGSIWQPEQTNQDESPKIVRFKEIDNGGLEVTLQANEFSKIAVVVFKGTTMERIDKEEEPVDLGPNFLENAAKWVDEKLANVEKLKGVEFEMKSIPSNFFAIKAIKDCEDISLIGCEDTTVLREHLCTKVSMESLSFHNCTDIWPKMLDIPAFINCAILQIHGGTVPSDVFKSAKFQRISIQEADCAQEDINCWIKRFAPKLRADIFQQGFSIELKEDADLEKLLKNVNVEPAENRRPGKKTYLINDDSGNFMGAMNVMNNRNINYAMFGVDLFQ